MTIDLFIRIIYLIGISSFAVSGVIASAKKQFDIFGCLVIGLICAISGGTLREVLLDRTPIYWASDTVVLPLIISICIISFILIRYIHIPRWLLESTDMIGLAAVSIIGAKTAIAEGANIYAVVIIGVLTGVTGEILRDILTGTFPPILLKQEIYAAASAAGCIIYLALYLFGLNEIIYTLISLIAIILIRILAIFNKWHLPKARLKN